MPSPDNGRSTPEILEHLEGVESRENGGWFAHCPIHDPEAQSSAKNLFIRERTEGKAVLKCYEGCNPESIKKALGLMTTSTPDEKETPPDPRWPSPLRDDAYQGPAGDLVETIAPHTEAAKPALLVGFLTGFGNLIGPGPHLRIEAAEHPGRLFSVLVGRTSKAPQGYRLESRSPPPQSH